MGDYLIGLQEDYSELDFLELEAGREQVEVEMRENNIVDMIEDLTSYSQEQ